MILNLYNGLNDSHNNYLGNYKLKNYLKDITELVIYSLSIVFCTVYGSTTISDISCTFAQCIAQVVM